jgi:hypothetical protein
LGEALGGIKTPPGLSPQGQTDLDAFRQDATNGASAEQLDADLAKVKADIQQQEQLTGKPIAGADGLEQKADQLVALAGVRDQLQEGTPADDLPLPTGDATIINNPALPAGQMVVLDDSTVLVGGAVTPPASATVLSAVGGGSMAVWTGTLADLGVPVQSSQPVADVVVPAGPTVADGSVPAGTTATAVVDPTVVPASGGEVISGSEAAPGAASIQVVLVNPVDSGGPIQYSLAGEPFSLEPGYQLEHQLSGPSIIEFDRGESFGLARYTLSADSYRFAVTDHGWEMESVPHAITIDNSDNPGDFHYVAAGEADVVPAKQSKTITGKATLRVAFDRGDGAEPAVKDLGDGSYKVGVDARTGLLDLFAAAEESAAAQDGGPQSE